MTLLNAIRHVLDTDTDTSILLVFEKIALLNVIIRVSDTGHRHWNVHTGSNLRNWHYWMQSD